MPLTDQQRSILLKEGTFHGLRQLLSSRQITDGEASEIIARSYGAVLQEIEEAKKELQHIQNALIRLESICRSGKQLKNSKPGDPLHTQLGDNVVIFDNWTVSLMETNLSITGMLNPALTRKKISEFATAMNALMDKRASQLNPVLDDKELFKGYISW
jgi:hypothetical protein